MTSALGVRSTRVAFFGSNVASISVCPRRLPLRTPLTVVAGWGQIPKLGPGRKWEHCELTKNGKPVKRKVHVKKGDTVQVITGKDKGKVGTVTSVDSTTGKILVEGVNIKTKAIKPKTENEQGQLKQYEFPIEHSNVMLYSKEKQVRSRVGHKVLEDGRKVRYLIKTEEIID